MNAAGVSQFDRLWIAVEIARTAQKSIGLALFFIYPLVAAWSTHENWMEVDIDALSIALLLLVPAWAAILAGWRWPTVAGAVILVLIGPTYWFFNYGSIHHAFLIVSLLAGSTYVLVGLSRVILRRYSDRFRSSEDLATRLGVVPRILRWVSVVGGLLLVAPVLVYYLGYVTTVQGTWRPFNNNHVLASPGKTMHVYLSPAMTVSVNNCCNRTLGRGIYLGGGRFIRLELLSTGLSCGPCSADSLLAAAEDALSSTSLFSTNKRERVYFTRADEHFYLAKVKN